MEGKLDIQEERWDPLGAPNDDDFEPESIHYECCEYATQAVSNKLRDLEEEQELLNSSLFALTTHFAQVQFRLRQVVNASQDQREELLKSLEEFAFRGIPDASLVKERMDEASLAEAVRLRRSQQKELIDRLKSQLRELEQYAFENGEAEIPQDIILEQQRIILNELKSRMNFELDEKNYHQMTVTDVKQQINNALDQMITPLKVKEHLVNQLKTQVADLERFIGYLQKETKSKCNCGCSYHSVKRKWNDPIGIIHKTATLLQIFAAIQLGCGTNYKRTDLKSAVKINHYGDLRAKLEIAILHVRDLAEANAKCIASKTPNYNNQLTSVIRKYLAVSIRDLMNHGATRTIQYNSVVPFIGCFPKSISAAGEYIHSWEIILEYYHLKNGEKFNSTPARKLSQSFNLEIAGAFPTSNKHTLLSTIGTIISTHTLYKRSYDSQFKAFICAALNANRLVPWLNLIFTCNQIVKTHYYPWSYVAKTGFQDSLKTLDVLTGYKFDLPVDLAIRQFQNIKDIFT